jgi:calcineurin-like phosphoesterase family protein
MNNTLVTNWNKLVGKQDDIYILGDFALCNSEKSNQLSNQLNGTKHFIKGSHDHQFKNLPYIIELKYKEYYFVLTHYCLRVWPRSHYNSFMCYGHSHGQLEPIGKSCDVGVDTNNFKPYSIDEIIKYMKTRPNNFNYIGDKCL